MYCIVQAVMQCLVVADLRVAMQQFFLFAMYLLCIFQIFQKSDDVFFVYFAKWDVGGGVAFEVSDYGAQSGLTNFFFCVSVGKVLQVVS